MYRLTSCFCTVKTHGYNKKQKWRRTRVRKDTRSISGPPSWRHGPLGYNTNPPRSWIRRLGDRHSRRPGKHNGDVPESDVCARVLEYQPGRPGREIRRHVQANRRQVRSNDSDIASNARKDSDFYFAPRKQHPNKKCRVLSGIRFFFERNRNFPIKCSICCDYILHNA